MNKVVPLRHGQSVWNKENRFTGWTDVDLSEQGRKEAALAGELLRKEGFVFDVAFTSVLKRAIRTLWIALDGMDLMWIPVHCDWRLNERHYGALQGLNKAATAAKYGNLQVELWRRSYAVRPPALARDDPRYPGNDPRYRTLKQEQLPLAECLEDTVARVVPSWEELIVPCLKTGKLVLIAAHGNSLRALVKYLNGISNEMIAELNIPTGVPLVYELDDELRHLCHYYLGSSQRLEDLESREQALS